MPKVKTMIFYSSQSKLFSIASSKFLTLRVSRHFLFLPDSEKFILILEAMAGNYIPVTPNCDDLNS